MTYTNVLEMLSLSQIPVLAAERNESHPLVIAGGTCVLNPEPIADFFDFFVIGDGEEVVLELIAGNPRTGKLKNYPNSSYCAQSRKLKASMCRDCTRLNISRTAR